MPPLLHGQAEARRHGRTGRALPAPPRARAALVPLEHDRRRAGRPRGRDDAHAVELGGCRAQAGRRDRAGLPRDHLADGEATDLPAARSSAASIALGESLAIGFRALAISANYAAQTEDDEEDFELSRGQIIFAFAIAIGFALALFKVGPALITSRLGHRDDAACSSSIEGLIRVGIFILYLVLISLLPDLRRLFQYHAAEHKAINAYEAGEELTPERVDRFSLIHPRCGTAFLLWVMVIAIFVFAFFGQPAWYWLIASRILMLPVIAGLAYELIRFAGKHQGNRIVMALLAPGLWLQRLTTRKPSLDQIEVSIRALQEVLEREGGITKAESRVEVMA